AVSSLSQDTHQMHLRILEFAGRNRMAELVAALSILSGVTMQQVDRLIHAPTFYGTMILCRALNLDWPIAEAGIRVPLRDGGAMTQVEEAHHEYPWLSAGSAQRLLRFWRVRDAVA